jgi:hypothetical protein
MAFGSVIEWAVVASTKIGVLQGKVVTLLFKKINRPIYNSNFSSGSRENGSPSSSHQKDSKATCNNVYRG